MPPPLLDGNNESSDESGDEIEVDGEEGNPDAQLLNHEDEESESQDGMESAYSERSRPGGLQFDGLNDQSGTDMETESKHSELSDFEESEGEDESENEAVGAVKVKASADDSENEEEKDDEDSGSGSDSDESEEMEAEAAEATEKASEASGRDSESSSDEEEDEFQAGTSSEEEDAEPASVEGTCMFCKQGEDQDPSGETASFLICSLCGHRSHPECARTHRALSSDDNSGKWRCPTCVGNSSEPKSQSPEDKSSRPRTTAPRLVRDLLPVHRGVQKPDSHSIFAQPLISEGEELDGTRKLRKRKSPTGEPPPAVEKRRRKAAPRAHSEAASNIEVGGAIKPNQDKMEILPPSVVRSTRASQRAIPLVRVIQKRVPPFPPPIKFILAFHIDQSKIAKILSKPPKKKRIRDRRDRRRPPKIPPPPTFEAPAQKFPSLPTSQHLIFPSILTERENDLNTKPYGGVLSEADADTSRSSPAVKDRDIFEAARKEAEEERRKASAAAEGEGSNEGTTITTRPNRTVSGPPSKIKCIQFGKFVIDTFYAAPYPEEYSHESKLFICEFCLKYLPSEFVAYRHKLKCPSKHPPGDEIYRDGSVSIWEVDGRKKTEYCQCLCLMAKMFLGSKTLYYDVEPFLFYILTEHDEFGYHFVGYFSKEKRPTSLNNVSCILVMPIHQRKGYATFLIDFSYLLTRIEGKEGSPEKPLSDMGLTAYRSYWDLTVSKHLLEMGLKPFSTRTLMDRTGMTADDVIHSLERLYAFIKDPVTKTYAIRFDRNLYETIVNENDTKGYRNLKSGLLVWTPYVMGRSDHAMLDGAPMQTVAPREDDENESDGKGPQKSHEPINGISPRNDIVNGDHGERQEDGEMADDEEILMRSTGEKKSASRSKSRSLTATSPNKTQDLEAGAAAKFQSPPVDVNGHIAPGPPPTSALDTPISTETAQIDLGLNGTTTHGSIVSSARGSVSDGKEGGEEDAERENKSLSGYALAFRTHAIPPTRFQIDPAIPPSMLRNRSSRKRPFAGAFGRNHSGPGASPGILQLSAVPVRSSPRNASAAASIAGNGNALANGVGTPDAVATPVRRSARASKLSKELLSLDGAMDDKKQEGDGDVVELDVSRGRKAKASASDSTDDEDEEEEEVVDDDDDDEEEEAEEDGEADEEADGDLDEDASLEEELGEDDDEEDEDEDDDEDD